MRISTTTGVNQSQKKKLFRPKSREDELSILLNDDPDFRNTKNYLDALILAALNRFEFSLKKRNQLRKELLQEVPVAAERFLSGDQNQRDFKFSTYFTWYIAQKINKQPNLKRKKPSNL